ncbi:MAG: hypothetical protein R3F34_20490 [Planctomycetota bacterium]
MYRIPLDLDLSSVVGEFTTQVRVGQFDIQFAFGKVNFAVQSALSLWRDGVRVGGWEEGRWPDIAFYDVMNTVVTRCEVANDRLLVIEFENGLSMHLVDDSDATESMQITLGDGRPMIVV